MFIRASVRRAFLYTARHPDARADRRKDGDERLNHDFPNFTFVHSGKGLKVQSLSVAEMAILFFRRGLRG